MDEMLAHRNKKLLRLFTSNGYEVRIVGELNRPAIILDEMVVLSCYVKNYDLHFTKDPFSEEIVKTINLKNENDVSKHELQEAIELSTHRQAYKIKLTGTDMYLVGYNYLSKDGLGKYPVFGRHKPKVYFDREYVDKLVETLNQEYSVEMA